MNAIDLFCGCGGFSQGLKDSGINVIAAIDVWDKAIESYKQNFNDLAICADLSTFGPEKLNDMFENKRIDILVGGPPCCGFSMAGRRDKKDPRSSLFMHFCEYLNYHEPKLFMMENVLGILSMKTENSEKSINIIMEQLGKKYDCQIHKVCASDYEVPQNRNRVIIVGIHKDLKMSESLRDFISPILEKQEHILVKEVTDWYTSKKRKNEGFGAQYLDMDKPSYTIPARYYKDGYDALVKYDETCVRRLTPLELKRIQSFPDDFVLVGNNKEVIMQIGNAIPCRLAYYLGQSAINTLLQ
ncbi:S-adenosyl-L-methionine-dependent methyltransferase [Dunaliella salina]|uniref:Cytosine-specific methyltransferase n=1 Tax=Dunaliella salina TaxID=3046 RepID=A0ABQ7G579_DUNSA|nr:S-adenosyl-L-methionine-dependent methyltransferase [Dunaliella salina]|eukprot:KAF5829756.1 S-adenosyl-L-methionine-dependent methyltransferase [Dunaliella salina]